MKPCSRCRRHLLSSASPCPFCGQDNRQVGEGSVLALGLGLVLAAGGGCSTGDKNTESSTNTPTTDGTQATQSSNDTVDQGGSYYAGPPTDSNITLDTSTTTTTTTTTATDTGTGTGTGTGTETDTNSTADDSLSDSGGSYYAGPATDTDVLWHQADPAKRPAP
ncbi:hypothetical protein [Nannocystis sp. SCPEA4]|uniref:hypothetical protein n=1 Tax=Nannocystis sp. SCPEA4 TaxID=2996787 RepID=UPI00226F0061|nr:hypothetical protein [Nannocystis sp. SCPEA4]MCY1054881.1 hypothetical protein [Nannocystis sp. SCPEA4]